MKQNNIAEVPKLREYLMREDFLMLSKQLMQATQIDVSYFAAGIIAHLASDGIEKWLVGSEKEEILTQLVGRTRGLNAFFGSFGQQGDWEVAGRLRKGGNTHTAGKLS